MPKILFIIVLLCGLAPGVLLLSYALRVSLASPALRKGIENREQALQARGATSDRLFSYSAEWAIPFSSSTISLSAAPWAVWCAISGLTAYLLGMSALLLGTKSL